MLGLGRKKSRTELEARNWQAKMKKGSRDEGTFSIGHRYRPLDGARYGKGRKSRTDVQQDRLIELAKEKRARKIHYVS